MATITRYSRSDPLAPGERDEAAALVRDVQDLVHRAVAPRRPATADELWEAIPRVASTLQEVADQGELTDEEAGALMDAYVSRAIAARISERVLHTLAGEHPSRPLKRRGRAARWLGI